MFNEFDIHPDTHALFFDLDGTLLELAETPEGVVFKDHVPDQLNEIYALYEGAMAIITGRSLKSLGGILGRYDLDFPQSGQHGFEFQLQKQGDVICEQVFIDQMRVYAPAVYALAEAHEGVFLEDKGACLGIHFRQRPELHDVIKSGMEHIMSQSDQLRIQAGHHIFEIKPKDFNKGHAIERFMEIDPFAGKIPVFLGDDLTDEFGFEYVNKIGGISIHVGLLRKTKANHRIKDVDHVHLFLTDIIEKCQNNQVRRAV